MEQDIKNLVEYLVSEVNNAFQSTGLDTVDIKKFNKADLSLLSLLKDINYDSLIEKLYANDFIKNYKEINLKYVSNWHENITNEEFLLNLANKVEYVLPSPIAKKVFKDLNSSKPLLCDISNQADSLYSLVVFKDILNNLWDNFEKIKPKIYGDVIMFIYFMYRQSLTQSIYSMSPVIYSKKEVFSGIWTSISREIEFKMKRSLPLQMKLI